MMSLDEYCYVDTAEYVPAAEDSTAMFGRPISHSRQLFTYNAKVYVHRQTC